MITNKASFGLGNGYAPAKGPRGLSLDIDFSSDSSQVVNISEDLKAEHIGLVQSVWIDNADNTATLTLTVQGTNQRLTIPAGWVGMQPLLAMQQAEYTIATTAASGLKVNITLLDVPMPYNAAAALDVAGGALAIKSSSFTRPADTTAYTANDLVANNTTAGSVTPMSWAIADGAGNGAMIRRARLSVSGTSITNGQFRLHLYTASPTPANDDNGAFSTDLAFSYLGAIDLTLLQAFTDGSSGEGVPNWGNEINSKISGSATVYGLLEALAAYTPTSGETITVDLEVWQE